MRKPVVGLLLAIGLAVGLSGASVIGQAGDTADAHIAAAKTAAGCEWPAMLPLCDAPSPRSQRGEPPASPQTPAPPDRSRWHTEPVKVFDNLYFVGQKDLSVWAVTTSDGIIVVDTIFDYSVEDEVVGGLKKLGLDPTKIKYAIITDVSKFNEMDE